MTKVYCKRYSCQYCFDGVCSKVEDMNKWKDPTVRTTDPWENCDKQLLRMKLLMEEISKDDVNRDT